MRAITLASGNRRARRWAMLACLGCLLPMRARAWGNKCTHPGITKNAIALLNAPPTATPGTQVGFYSEFSLYQSTIAQGSIDEDIPKLRSR